MTASDYLQPRQFYHGTTHDFQPGDMVEPGHPANFPVDEKAYPNPGKDVFFTHDDIRAMRYAQQAWARTGDSPKVYQVEPTGEYQQHYASDSYRSKSPLRVIGEA